MSDEIRYDYVQWGYDLIRNAYLNKSENVDQRDNLYFNYLLPFSKEVYSQKNSLLLFGSHDYSSIKNCSEILVRDGIIPLTLFFNEVSPSDFSAQLYISKDFWFLVPEIWRPRVKFYEIKAKKQFDKKNLPRKIFLSGILNSTLADPDEFEESLVRLVSILGKENLEKIELMAYFPDKRNDLWGSWDEENVLKYSAMIFKNLGLEIDTPKLKRIEEESNFNNYLYYEINVGNFIKDSFLMQLVLSRGGGLLNEAQVEDDRFKLIAEVGASVHHSYLLYEFDYGRAPSYEDPLKGPHSEYFKRVLGFQNRGIRLNYEWEKWYASYIKKFYKNKRRGEGIF